MKKLLILGLLSAGLSVNAAEMSFITVLSSPVGSFNRLEVVDSAQPASASRVNFCTKVGTSGTVQLQGLDSASLGNLTLASDVVLGRSGSGDYVLNSISLNSGGAVTGSRLLANNVTVSGQGVGKSSNLYGTTLTVAGAKTAKLNVNNGASQITLPHEAADMVWSNEYQNDTAACGTKCNQQYLLKSKGTAAAAGGDCSNRAYRLRNKSECCPSWPDKEDTACYRRSYVWNEVLENVLSGYDSVYVRDAYDCSSLTLTYSAPSSPEDEVYPSKWNYDEFVGEVDHCGSRVAGQACDPDIVKGARCFLGLGGAANILNNNEGWIYALRQVYKEHNQGASFYYPHLVSTTWAGGAGCLWSGVKKWPQLECAQVGPFEKYGW